MLVMLHPVWMEGSASRMAMDTDALVLETGLDKTVVSSYMNVCFSLGINCIYK